RIGIDRLYQAQAPERRRAPLRRPRLALGQAIGEAGAALHPVTFGASRAGLAGAGLAAHLAAPAHVVQQEIRVGEDELAGELGELGRRPLEADQANDRAKRAAGRGAGPLLGHMAGRAAEALEVATAGLDPR